MSTVGHRLRQAREAKGLSRPDVLKAVDLSITTLGSWERDQNVPDGPIVAKLAPLYGVTTDWIWGVTDQHGGPAYPGPAPPKGPGPDEEDPPQNGRRRRPPSR